MREAFELVVRVEGQLRVMLRSVVGKRFEDDAWTECVLERAPRVFELWDPKRTPSVERYFVWAMRAYAGKWLARHLKFIGQETRVPRSSADISEIKSTRVVKPCADHHELLEGLSEYDAWLVRSHVVEGHTFEALAKAAGVSKRLIRLRYHAAIDRAREMLDDH